MSDIFSDAGFSLPTQAKSAVPVVSYSGDIFSDAGFSLPTYAPDSKEYAAAPTAASAAPMIGGRALDPWETTPGAGDPNPTVTRPKTWLETVHDAIPDPNKILSAAAQHVATSTAENFQGSKSLAAGGMQDIRNRDIAPSFPSSDPRSWGAGGVLKAAAGGVGMATAPVSGALDALVAHPVTELTGNPDIGNRASFVAGSMLGLPKAVSVVRDATPASKAINALVAAVGPENVPAAVARMQSNPRLALMDVSDPVRTLAQGLIDPAQPEAQNIVSDAVKGRIASAPAAVNAAYDRAMGAAPDVVKVVDSLKQKAQDVGSKMIQPAIENSGPVDISNVVKSLDNTIGPYALKALKEGESPKLPMTGPQQTAWDVRQRLRGTLPDRPTMFLDAPQAHEIQSQLRYEASQLASSAVGSERLTAGQVGNVRGQLVDAIDKASPQITDSPADFLRAQPNIPAWALNAPPAAQAKMASALGWVPKTTGSYKAALSKYRDAKMVQEAFESGFDTLKNRSGVSGLEDRPEAFQQWIKNASPEEVVARQLGTRADIDQKINGMRFAARHGTDIPDIEYNQQKLKMLFGDQEASRLINTMNDFRDEAVTNSKILANSKTAETFAGKEALAVPKVKPFQLGNITNALLPSAMGEIAAEYAGAPPGLVGTGLFATGLALGGARKGVQAIQKQSAVARNIAIARAASATGTARQETINALMRHPKVIRSQQGP